MGRKGKEWWCMVEYLKITKIKKEWSSDKQTIDAVILDIYSTKQEYQYPQKRKKKTTHQT